MNSQAPENKSIEKKRKGSRSKTALKRIKQNSVNMKDSGSQYPVEHKPSHEYAQEGPLVNHRKRRLENDDDASEGTSSWNPSKRQQWSDAKENRIPDEEFWRSPHDVMTSRYDDEHVYEQINFDSLFINSGGVHAGYASLENSVDVLSSARFAENTLKLNRFPLSSAKVANRGDRVENGFGKRGEIGTLRSSTGQKFNDCGHSTKERQHPNMCSDHFKGNFIFYN